MTARGRFLRAMGLFETIRMTDALRVVIRTYRPVRKIATAFRRDGMLYMQCSH
jgi:hypothetical protein